VDKDSDEEERPPLPAEPPGTMGQPARPDPDTERLLLLFD
jgi:hypothetical protein